MSTSTKGLTTKSALVLTKKGQSYSPRATSVQDNAASWDLVKGAMSKPQTMGSLQTLLKQRNHANFVGYAVRRGWLAAK